MELKMYRCKVRSIGRALLTVIVATALCNVSFADPIKFKIATIAPDGTPWALLLNTFKKKVRKDSGKSLMPRVYSGRFFEDKYSWALKYGKLSRLEHPITANLSDILRALRYFRSISMSE